MDWQNKLNQIIDYLETEISGSDDIDLIRAARHAGFSLWEYQRLFSFLTNTTVGSYIRKRRMNLAANDIFNSNEKIIDIALKYGYESPTAFSRAFSQLFGVSPSYARVNKTPLTPYPRLTFQTINDERVDYMEAKNNVKIYSERGYYVKENEPIYYSQDIEKTINWFGDALGWFGGVIARDENGVAVYGGVDDYPHDEMPDERRFLGFQLGKGEPSKGVVGCIKVRGLENLRKFVLKNGWEQISEIEPKPYGTNECFVTTIDGSSICFFEIKNNE